MIHTNYSNYNYTISYQKPQSYMKELGSTTVMTEKSDTGNDVYRNASTKAVLAAKVERYSQGTFDLSLLVAGGNSESYFNSAGQYYEYKEMLNSILEYKRLNGEVPQYHVSYAWSGRHLSEWEE